MAVQFNTLQINYFLIFFLMGWKKADFFFLNNTLPGEKNYNVGLAHQEWQTWSSHAVLRTSDKDL